MDRQTQYLTANLSDMRTEQEEEMDTTKGQGLTFVEVAMHLVQRL